MKSYNTKIKLFSLIISCIAILGYSQTAQSSFHDTKGNIEVTQAGQLQYTLAIDVPPGVKNISPNVSLIYTSGGQNGLAGYGWNVAGLSSISRVGKNLEKDGITKGVQLDYSDYFSFNGQRLILKSGEYGKDGAEYVTEKYSNIKIKSYGSVTGQVWQSPEYWEVTFEDGSQAWYGATASGSSPARTPIDFNIVKSKDINGNYITYNYILDGNVSVISNIQWGGNEVKNTPHFNKIEFAFDVRPMPETAYIKGVGFSQSKILQSITVTTNNHQYKKYNVTYKQDLQQTAYRYLDTITVLNGNNEAANPVTFTYEKSMDLPNPNIKTWALGASLRPKDGEDLVGDFDGDGNLDLLRYHSTTSTKTPQIGLYLYSNFYRKSYYYGSPTYIGNTLTLADFRGATAVNLKKDNLIYNRQGFVTKKLVANPSTSKNDLELSFYDITENNQLVLDYKRVIPNANYDYSSGTATNGTRTSIIGLKNVDLDGDGLSELILQLNDIECHLATGSTLPDDPNTCDLYNRYCIIDVNRSDSQLSDWFYEITLGIDQQDIFKTGKAGDFNGDGLFDLIQIDSDKKPMLTVFEKNSQGKYVSNITPFQTANNELMYGLWEDGVVGDFNGDGLSDMMIPTANDSDLWYLYTSKGNAFIEETKNFVRPNKNRVVSTDINQNISIGNPRVFAAYDINNDGKAELILLGSSRYYQKAYPQDSNQGVKYVRSVGSYVDVLATFGGGGNPPHSTNQPNAVNTTLYLNDSNIDAELALDSKDLIGLSVDQWTGAMLRRVMLVSMVEDNANVGEEQAVASHPYYDISMEGRIKSISQGGITTDITYKQLDKSINPGLYDVSQTENYPYVQISQSTGMYVVSGITQSTTSDKVLKQDFRYRGLTSNILGKGMVGFKKTARSSWYADGFENTKIWTGIEIDPVNDGVPVKEWSIRTNDETKIFPADVSENNTELLSFKSTTYQIDKLLNGQVVATVPDADKAKVVTAIVPKTSKGKDFLSGTIAESTVTYGTYYLPTQNVSKINTNYSVKTLTYEYTHNPSGVGANYYIGRPTSKTEIVQAYSDSKTSKEEYTYQSNRIKTLKTWNRDNTGYVLDTYTYDDFGNITQKVTSNSLDVQIRTAKSEYEAKGRFIANKTDHLGLVTSFVYNDSGQVLTQTDPVGNTLTNTYDAWGKLLTSESNLEGTTTYEYDRDNNANIIVTQNDPDGNISKTYTNKLGQEYKSSTKTFGQGQSVSKETQYDVLGRKIKESEPYFEGQSASQWNTIAYDDTVFPAKVTATAFTGKQTLTTVSGLTTTVVESNGYGRTTSKTSDALGNVISTTDKGGTVQFSYNAAGDQIQATYAENIVTTKYDVWGRKSEFNDPSNGLYKYEYNGLGQPKKTTSPKGTKEYTYNNLGQLISQTEISTIDGGQTTNKNISYTYDNKGRITAKSGTSLGQAYSFAISYDPQGRLSSTVENSNGRTYAQKSITYDDKGRISSYEKELQSSGILTKVQIQNVYNSWNGELYQIKDQKSGTILWELQNTNARGQVLKAKLGAADVSNTYDANGFLTNISHSSVVKPTILNVKYNFDAIKNELAERTTLGDFNILEKFSYDDNNRLVTWTNPLTGQDSDNKYDIKGRITDNDQVGKIKFENSAKIYQPTGMTLNAAGIENYDNDLIQSISFNENNDPVFIDGMKGDVAFQYGLTGMRQMSTYGGNFSTDGTGRFTKLYSEDGGFEVIRDNTTNQEKHILYIEGTPYISNIVYLKNFNESSGSFNFLHKDYLGSILAITDEKGNKLEQRHFDAWGNLTHLKIGETETITDKNKIAEYLSKNGLIVDRGYTSHEHFTEVGIIHMNGRLYDPLLRRFLNADENIQDPYNTQNYNKYGYVMNNPVMYNDPNGEFLLWAAGALIGGYLNGVAANGSWNPGKWDWEKTWGAVLGGAIGGAAISGALGNIANNPGAIKNFLPGLVSGGLSSAFNGSNFLGGIIGGLSYTSNVFDNKMTSTNLANADYKYIVSPDYNDLGDGSYNNGFGPGNPFTRTEINTLVAAGIMSAATAKLLMTTAVLEGAGTGIAIGSSSSSAAGGTFATILTRAISIGLLLSIKDDAPPSRYYVYIIKGSKTTELAKIGITRQSDPSNRPQSQIAGLNARYSDFGAHSWAFIQGPVSREAALLYEKYYVWEYNQNWKKMPYAQSYPYADALTRYLEKFIYNK